jgi:HPt (histidine-containing phosphotransfer) domain-containing protein
LETSRAIRKSSDVAIRNVPIIALTAGVSKAEREECFKAGMNGFLSKPINKDTLYSVLIDYFLNQDKPNVENTENEEPEIQHFQKDTLLEKIGFDASVFDQLVELTLKEYPKYIETLESAIDTNDLDEIKSTAHKLKGSAFNMEFNVLGNLAKEIEINCENKEKLPSLFDNIKTEWQKVSALI